MAAAAGLLALPAWAGGGATTRQIALGCPLLRPALPLELLLSLLPLLVRLLGQPPLPPLLLLLLLSTALPELRLSSTPSAAISAASRLWFSMPATLPAASAAATTSLLLPSRCTG
jgi:hypothetical protein